jgi:hypothetical protein
MPTQDHFFAQLHCHVETPCENVASVESQLHYTPDGDLSMSYVLKGRVDLLRVPAPVPPRRKDGLWHRTCFEAFIAVKGTASYYEFNFSPSSEWAAYAFRSYRNRAALMDGELDPGITLGITRDQLELHAVVRLKRLPGIAPGAALRVGLAAVVEERDGRLSYWALKHPVGRPDFHHPDGFVLELQRPVDAAGDPAYNPTR